MPSRDHRAWYSDLLRIPYSEGGRDPARGLDCLGVCWVVLRRLRGDAAIDRLVDWQTEEASTVAAFVATMESSFEQVGSTRIPESARAGDIILQMLPGTTPLHPRPHVSVIVWPDPPRTLLTATRGRGVVAVPSRLVGAVEGVYRLRGTKQ